LVFALVNGKPINVVVSQNEEANCHIITVYEPDIDIWDDNDKTKRKE
jgi:hypothetical protein